MGCFKSFCGFIGCRVLPILVAVLAIFFGYLSTTEIPEGTLFASVYPVSKGLLPPVLFGPLKTPLTRAVPEGMTPAARPEGEMFLQLPSGNLFPQNGLGMCCRASAYDHESARRSVLWYLLQGGRHIDTAHLYLNHKAVGEAIREAISRGIPRSQIFVTTKVFVRQFGRDATAKHVPIYLQQLGLDYIDLVLIHMPSTFSYITNECTTKNLSHKQCREETWKSLSEARDKGLVKDVGVSNFNVKQMKEIMALNLAPLAANQFQYNPWAPDNLQEAFEFCKQNNIAVTAWSSMAGTMMQVAQALTVKTLKSTAAKYSRTVAQVLLRWAVQKGAVVIPGTGNPEHMKENLELYNFKLSDEDMAAIDSLRNDPSAQKFMFQPPDHT